MIQAVILKVLICCEEMIIFNDIKKVLTDNSLPRTMERSGRRGRRERKERSGKIARTARRRKTGK